MNLSDFPEHLQFQIREQLAATSGGKVWMSAPPVPVIPGYSDNPTKAKTRIRQASGPLMNKLEAEFHERLKSLYPGQDFHPQAKRFKLGNGIWYKPDFTASGKNFSQERAWEVKGSYAFRGGFENLKVAAALWPEVLWVLVWKQDGVWKEQHVLS